MTARMNKTLLTTLITHIAVLTDTQVCNKKSGQTIFNKQEVRIEKMAYTDCKTGLTTCKNNRYTRYKPPI